MINHSLKLSFPPALEDGVPGGTRVQVQVQPVGCIKTSGVNFVSCLLLCSLTFIFSVVDFFSVSEQEQDLSKFVKRCVHVECGNSRWVLRLRSSLLL